MKVYLVLKHPKHPYGYGHLEAAIVDSVYLDKEKAKELVAKNEQKSITYLWTVKTKEIKD